MVEQDLATQRDGNPRKLAWWRFIPWFLALCCLAGLLWVRFGAELDDFGLQNVVSYILGFFFVLDVLIGLMLTTARRVWVTTLLLLILAIGAFFVVFRLERVDAEIVPQFVWRWTEAVTLPESDPKVDLTNEAFFAAQQSDFPQFLGPNSDATLASLELDADWKENPPQIAWKHPIGKGWSGFAVQGDAAYTLEQREQEEWVTCYDANSGKLIWHYATAGLHFNPLGGTGPRSTPAIHDGRVYAQSAVSELACLDMRTGEKVWSADLLELASSTQAGFEADVAWGRSGSPLVVDDLVVVPLGGSVGAGLQALIAFDAQTGAERWRGGNDQIGYSTPLAVTLGGVRQIIYISEMKLAGYSIADGKELWSAAWPSRSSNDANVSQPVVVDDSHVLMTKGYGGGAQLLEVTHEASQWKTQSLWRKDGVLRTKFTSCVVKDNHAYGLSDGILECVDLATGKRAWKKGRYRHGQVLLVGDKLLVTAENGSIVLVAVDSQKFRELATLPVIGDVTWNTAALSGDRLLMRNSDEAACVLLPLKSAASEPAADTTAARGVGK